MITRRLLKRPSCQNSSAQKIFLPPFFASIPQSKNQKSKIENANGPDPRFAHGPFRPRPNYVTALRTLSFGFLSSLDIQGSPSMKRSHAQIRVRAVHFTKGICGGQPD